MTEEQLQEINSICVSSVAGSLRLVSLLTMAQSFSCLPYGIDKSDKVFMSAMPIGTSIGALACCATDDVRLMTKAAVEAVDRIYRLGFKYSKAEVLLVSLCQKDEYTEDLFSITQPVASEKVMGVLDSINERWGRGTLRLASVPANPDWGMRREMMSQSFTTRVDQL